MASESDQAWVQVLVLILEIINITDSLLTSTSSHHCAGSMPAVDTVTHHGPGQSHSSPLGPGHGQDRAGCPPDHPIHHEDDGWWLRSSSPLGKLITARNFSCLLKIAILSINGSCSMFD